MCWVFVAVQGLPLVETSGGYSLLWCVGFSLQWLILLCSMGFMTFGLQQRWANGLGRCDTRTQLPLGMWDLLGPVIKPVSPALQGRLLTTGPPGKPIHVLFTNFNFFEFCGTQSPLKLAIPALLLGYKDGTVLKCLFFSISQSCFRLSCILILKQLQPPMHFSSAKSSESSIR